MNKGHKLQCVLQISALRLEDEGISQMGQGLKKCVFCITYLRVWVDTGDAGLSAPTPFLVLPSHAANSTTSPRHRYLHITSG